TAEKSEADDPARRLASASQLSFRDHAAGEARDLLTGERRVGELLAQVEHAEQVHDVVHPLVEVRPVARAAVIDRWGNWLEPRHELPHTRGNPRDKCHVLCIRWGKADQSRAPQLSTVGGTGSNRASSSFRPGSVGP